MGMEKNLSRWFRVIDRLMARFVEIDEKTEQKMVEILYWTF